MVRESFISNLPVTSSHHPSANETTIVMQLFGKPPAVQTQQQQHQISKQDEVPVSMISIEPIPQSPSPVVSATKPESEPEPVSAGLVGKISTKLRENATDAIAIVVLFYTVSSDHFPTKLLHKKYPLFCKSLVAACLFIVYRLMMSYRQKGFD